MLQNVHIKNLAIIEEADIDFLECFNILTGETGAGKSILIGSITIALGGKVSMDMVRKGAEYALIELTFHITDEVVLRKLDELDIPVEDGQVIISRRIRNGRSLSKINGEAVTSAVLKELSSYLIDIHGQHEHQSLLYSQKQLDIVDRYCGDEVSILKQEIKESYHAYNRYWKEWKEAVEQRESRQRQLSFMEYEIQEIEAAKLLAGEDEQLAKVYRKLQNANKIAENVSLVYGITGENDGSVSDLLGRASKELNQLEEADEQLTSLCRQLNEMESLLHDFNRELSDYMEELEYEPAELQKIEERLNLINGLKAKYGDSIEDILEYHDKLVRKLEKYKKYDIYLEELKEKTDRKEYILKEKSEQLSLIRKNCSHTLENAIREVLQELNFSDVRFQITVERLEHYTANGYDMVSFLIATNPGEDMKALAKVASGGELSRIMLAIKSVLAGKDGVDTLIFDEIDTGISGRTAQKVSERLAEISRRHQVILITHLPQIAAMADNHYIIEKKLQEERMVTNIRELSDNESVNELARMLGGVEITESVLNNAEEMKRLASDIKKKL